MRIEYLKYLIDVAEHQSIAKAARINFISSQGMSRVIHELEKEFGHTLIERYPNKLKLTSACKQLLPYIENVQREYDKLNDAIAMIGMQSKARQTFTLHLLCQRIASIGILPQNVFLPSGSDGVKILYREMDNEAIFSTLNERSKRMDTRDDIPEVGLVAFYDQINEFPGNNSDEPIHYRPYLKTYDVAVVSSHSRFAKKDFLTKAEILQYPILSSNSQLYGAICRRFGEDSVSMATGNLDFRIALVERDEGLSFLPAALLLPTFMNLHDIVAIPFEDTYPVEFGFVGAQEDLDSKPFRRFIKMIDEYYEPYIDSGLFTLCDMGGRTEEVSSPPSQAAAHCESHPNETLSD